MHEFVRRFDQARLTPNAAMLFDDFARRLNRLESDAFAAAAKSSLEGRRGAQASGITHDGWRDDNRSLLAIIVDLGNWLKEFAYKSGDWRRTVLNQAGIPQRTADLVFQVFVRFQLCQERNN
jgi:hypothetical protein